MTEVLNISIESEDLKNFKETTGMSLTDCVKILMNSVKYGGKLEFDTFWSDEHLAKLQKSIREIEEGKVVSFSDEEWEKFVNEQNIS